jgi:hypothetical protein
VDLSKLTTSDRLILGGGIAYLICMFLPWYGLDYPGGSYTASGWDYFLGGVIPLILILIMALHVAITRFSPDTKLPDLPLPWSQVHLAAGAAAAAIVLLRLIIASDNVGSIDTGLDFDRKFGLFLALIAAIVVAAGGYLKSKEGDDAPAAGDGTGSAPF